MSTRSTTHFVWKEADKPYAIVYRHPDGYPEGHGADLYRFLRECAKLEDNRFTDPSYLAAKLVVWLADQFRYDYRMEGGEFTQTKHNRLLDFLSVGVVMKDPADIEYRYTVRCGTRDEEGLPIVECRHAEFYGSPSAGQLEAIPRPPKEA